VAGVPLARGLPCRPRAAYRAARVRPIVPPARGLS